MNLTILRHAIIDSTNAAAMEHARRGAGEGLVVIARRQTAGRGRHGRKWVSEPDAGLYFSIVLRPKVDPATLPLITLMSGVAVHDALSEYGLRPDVKWVNDVLINDRKISGILAETTETPDGLAVIVGIGINIKRTAVPVDLSETATSIEGETGKAPTADDVCEVLTRYLTYFYGILTSDDGAAAILHEWRTRSSYYSGRSVRVATPDGLVIGITDGLEPNGALRVKSASGDVAIIQAGTVERLRASEQ